MRRRASGAALQNRDLPLVYPFAGPGPGRGRVADGLRPAGVGAPAGLGAPAPAGEAYDLRGRPSDAVRSPTEGARQRPDHERHGPRQREQQPGDVG